MSRNLEYDFFNASKVNILNIKLQIRKKIYYKFNI